MRIAIIASSYSAHDGGAHAFEQSILHALSQSAAKHTFLFFDIKGNLLSDISKPNTHRQFGLDSVPTSNQQLRPNHHNKKCFKKISKKILQYSKRLNPLFKISPESHLSLDQNLHQHKIEFVWFSYPACSEISIPYALTVWDLAHRSTPCFPEISLSGWDWSAREAFYHRYIPRASVVITGTQAGKAEISKYYGVADDNIVVNPLPVPIDVVHTSEHQSPLSAALESSIDVATNQPFFFYPAQFWPHKNHANLLLALQIVRQNYAIDISLVLTGSDKGNLDYIKGMIAELGLENCVKLLGFVSRNDIISLYQHAVALVYVSLIGPDNIPPLEAMALGCPVISGSLAGSKEQFGDAALLFDPTDPSDIAACMLAIYSDHNLQKRLIHNGHQIIFTRSVDSYMAVMNDIFDRFSARRRCWGLTYQHS